MEEKNPEEAVKYFAQIKALEEAYNKEPHNVEIREVLARIEGKDPLTYASLPPEAIQKKIIAHKKRAEELVKEHLSYDWLIKNYSIGEVLSLLLGVGLPELKDKDKYKEIVSAQKKIKEAQSIMGKEIGEKIEYVKKYFGERKGKTIGEEMIKESELYAGASSSIYLDFLLKGINSALQYELARALEKAGAKKTLKKAA